ncbi:hypothetical protein TUMSATVNIG1_58130 (plasmid) [Vibrio nigripulchritudo]|uniref:hypothetical protein n=1 Tax=Vibrio nigripulchritudo TaxID=28173 RepID=UPI00190E213D|nr:hypothetical protein [Vibrio nigripulchritudo]BCL73827.1 hypothetical protein VNTUMSATTG_57640 [Vibrio nigripulchritudo]BDU35204.1 hypothetical protein TUMSATVNIG1_58130 [Vibrio nigripulchritudo]
MSEAETFNVLMKHADKLRGEIRELLASSHQARLSATIIKQKHLELDEIHKKLSAIINGPKM